MSLVVDEHRQYLDDKARVAAFRQAIREIVKPGNVVLDLGCGTGILGLLACQAGAARVYAIDGGGMIQLAREICLANGFQDRIIHINGLSTQVDLPERVDVVVADQIGRFGFEAGVFEYFADARERFLKPAGRTIPARVDLYVAPVEHRVMWNQVEFWSHSPAGLNFSPVRPLATNTGYPSTYRRRHLLGKPAVLASLDPSNSPKAILGLQASIVATRKGTLHGIGGWFLAQLSAHVTMSNSPLAHHPINRHNVFFPLDRPVKLAKGDQVRVQMSILPTDTLVTWTVEVWGFHGNGRSSKQRIRKARETTHSTFQGMLLCQDDLRKTRPDFIPKLTSWGEARLSVLALCDGQKPLEEIERELYQRHSKLFRSPAEAAKFASEVITSYAL